jgi:hypothetical protein
MWMGRDNIKINVEEIWYVEWPGFSWLQLGFFEFDNEISGSISGVISRPAEQLVFLDVTVLYEVGCRRCHAYIEFLIKIHDTF